MTCVTAVIVTHNSATLLPGCLNAVARAAKHGWLQVVVVDSGSSDSSVAVARASQIVDEIILLDGNRGYAAGINAGVTARPADAYLALNPDCRMAEGSVDRMAAAMVGDVGIVAPRMLDGDGQAVSSLRREPTLARAIGEAVIGGGRAAALPWFGEVIGVGREAAEAGNAAWAVGAALMFSDACRQAVGGWDDQFFLYSEETDFALRAADAGFRLAFVPDAEAHHFGGNQSTDADLWALSAANRVRCYGKRHGRLATALYRAAVMLNELLRAPFRSRHRAALRALTRPAPTA